MRVEAADTLAPAEQDALEAFWVRAWAAVMPSLDFEARRPWLRMRLAALRAGGVLLLLVRDEGSGSPVGFLTLDAVSGLVDQLAVDPACGGRGIGRALMAEAQRRAPPQGLRLTVNAGNPGAITFYARAGFATTGQGINPRSGLPVLHMAWEPGRVGGCQARTAGVTRAVQSPPRSLSMTLALTTAQTLAGAALAHARDKAMKPLVVVVLDARGAVKAALAEDGTSLKRFEVAHGKAYGALSLGMGSRSIAKRATEQAYFVAAVTHVVGGSLVPVAGGVLLRDASGAVVGAAGASGDTSDNDEAAVLAGIAATDLKGDPGQD